MKKLSSFAAVCGGLLFVSACVGLMTAPATMAQAGTGKDVRVVNTTAEAVPVHVTQLPAVQISGTPTVNVGNTPNVNVSSLPAVQVGNGAANPVPVNVTNLPAVQMPGDPVSFARTISLAIGDTAGSIGVFTVPAGKRLVIEYFNCDIVSPVGTAHIVAFGAINKGLCRFLPDSTRTFGAFGVSTVSRQVQYFVEAGESLDLFVSRDDGIGVLNLNCLFTGHLLNVS